MNYYKILYQELTKLKSNLEARSKDIAEELKVNIKNRNKTESTIGELKRDKAYKNHVYGILVNYKSFIKTQLLGHIKASGAVAGIIFAVLFLAGLIVSVVTKQFLLQEILWCLPVSVVISSVFGIVSYKDSTKYNRDIYKKHNNQLYAFPVMIYSLDKKMQIEMEIRNSYQTEIENLNEIRDMINSDVKIFDQCLEYIEKRIPEVYYPCRGNNEAINEVYENDPEVMDIQKLIREKNY